MQFHILGTVQLHVAGRDIPLRTIKVRGLLAILLLSPNTPVPADKIIGRLWDDEYIATKGHTSPPDRHKTLQLNVTRLRTEFRRADVPARVINDQRSYRLEVDRSGVDYHRFRELAAEGRRAIHQRDYRSAATTLRAALDLWQGEPFPDLTTSWAQNRRESMVTQEFLPVCVQLVDAHLALGQYDQAADRLEPLIADHNLNETLAAQWMRAKAAIDGPSTLPDYLRTFTERFRKQFNTEPNQLTAVYEDLTRVEIPERPQPVPHQLPRPTPHFTGRRATLAMLDHLLLTTAPAPVVAIDGPPGVGKSTLVVEWANAHRDNYPDGQLFIDLSGHGPSGAIGSTAVLTSFLAALNVPAEHLPPGADDRAALLRSTLDNRRVLIVLDNARDSEHIRRIVAAAPSATVLVTSRQQLTGLVHRDGARRLTLAKLRTHESIALLTSRLGQARARPDSPVIRDLADLCDGLPLGLSIAAEHVAARSNAPLKDLVRALRQERRLLLDAGVHGDEGDHSLRAVFSWSYHELRPDAKQMFVLLGLLPTPNFHASAAAAITGISLTDARKTLDLLRGANLVDEQAVDRFRCHDLIFLFAGELAKSLPTDTRKTAIHRTLDWYLTTTTNAVHCLDPHQFKVPPLEMTTDIRADSFDGEEQALRWCTAERSNIPAVSQLAADLGFHDHAWRLIGVFDEILYRYGHPAELLDIHKVALASAHTSGHAEGAAGILSNIGALHFRLGEYEQAARHFDEARTAHQKVNNTFGEAVSIMNVASTYLERGRHQDALETYRQSLTLFEQIDEPVGQAHNRHRIGDVYRRMHCPTTASRYYMESLRISERIGHLRNQGKTLMALGELHLEQDEPAVAISYCERAIVLHRRTLDEQHTGETLYTLAAAYFRIHRPSDAIPLAREAVECHGVTGNRRGRAKALDILGQAYWATGQAAQARTVWTNAVSLFQELQDPEVDAVQQRIDGLDKPPTEMPRPRGGLPVNEALGGTQTAQRPETTG